MKFYRIISDGYILAVGTDIGGMEITAAKYDEILTVIAAKPARTERRTTGSRKT